MLTEAEREAAYGAIESGSAEPPKLVVFGGRFAVGSDGRITAWDNSSGHFRPLRRLHKYVGAEFGFDSNLFGADVHSAARHADYGSDNVAAHRMSGYTGDNRYDGFFSDGLFIFNVLVCCLSRSGCSVWHIQFPFLDAMLYEEAWENFQTAREQLNMAKTLLRTSTRGQKRVRNKHYGRY